MISFDQFMDVELRIGTITAADDFPEAHKPAYKLTIDFGPDVGVKRSSARITDHYTKEELVGRQVMCVTNFPPKQIGPYISEVLVTGFDLSDGTISLAGADRIVPNGTRLS
jgi:tRNA-binding protein